MPDPLADAIDLAALDERDPHAAARVALAAATELHELRKRRRLELLRAEPPDRLLAAAHHASTKHLTARVTKRPVPPAYRIERTPIRELTKTAGDVIAFVEANDGFHLLWSACVLASDIDPALRHRTQHDALMLGDDVEKTALIVRSVLSRRKALLTVDEMLRLTDWGYMFTEESAPSLAGHAELTTPEACLDVLERLIDAQGTDGAFEPTDHNFGRFLIRRLAAAKHAPACPLLAALAAVTTPYSRVKGDAVAALRDIGGRAAVDAIVAALDRIVEDAQLRWDPNHMTLFGGPLFAAILEVDDVDPFVRFAPFFDPARTKTETGAQIAKDAIAVIQGSVGRPVHAVVKLLHPDAAPAGFLGADPRWIDRFVGMLGDKRLRLFAKEVLKSLAPLAVKESMARVVGPPVKPAKAPALDLAVVQEADARASAIMEKLRAALELVIAQRKKAKLPLTAKGKALASVDAAITSGKLAEIEKLTKLRLPSTIRAFYMILGAVDFRPLEPVLFVQPIDRALRDLKRRVRDNTGVPLPLRDVLALELAPQLAVLIDVWTFDPLLDGVAGEGAETTFLDHLRQIVAGWQIPGLPSF